jgi:alcohol dehydrogenase (NADP+)
VSRVGPSVTKFKVGDTVGVGCFVGSCGECDRCKEGLENYCQKGATGTYNAKDSYGQQTYGGYSKQIVVHERFVLRVDPKQKLEAVAPLLCAGITTWSPLKHWKIGKGHKVGVLGLGGLGHMAVKLASALGAEVTLISTSESKKKDGERLGAHDFIATSAIGKAGPRFDLIIDTVSAKHDLGAVLSATKFEGTVVMLGASPEPLPLGPFPLIMGRRSLSGSLVGGIPETQEMLDFCAAKNITADVETVAIQKVDEAYERMLKGDVRYRFTIDLASL